MVRFPFLCPANGVSNYQNAAAKLTVGGQVLVEHEPGNPHDPNAVRIATVDGWPVGYVPAALAARLVTSHGTGCRFHATVADIVGTDTLGVRVEITGPAGPVTATGPLTVGQAVEVAGSGRPVGTVVSVLDDRRVLVSGPAGPVPYPTRVLRPAS